MLAAAPGLRPMALFDEMLRRHPALSAEHPAHPGAPGPRLAGAARPGAGRDLPPGPSAGRAGPVGLHRRGRPRRHHRRPAAGAPALPFPPRLLRLRSMPRWCSAARASWPWPAACRTRCGRLGGAPREHRSDSLSAAFRNLDDADRGGPDPALRGVVRPLRHAADPQQPWRRARERRDRGPHGHLKTALAQALLLRGIRVRRSSMPIAASLTRSSAGRTPPAAAHRGRTSALTAIARACAPTTSSRRWSPSRAAAPSCCSHVFYTVPSRLIGHRLRVRHL